MALGLGSEWLFRGVGQHGKAQNGTETVNDVAITEFFHSLHPRLIS